MEAKQDGSQELDDFDLLAMLAKARRDRQSAEKAKANTEGRWDVTRGLARGVDSMQATYQGAIGMGQSLVGNDVEAARRFANYQDEMRQSSENPASVEKFFSSDPKSGAFGSASNMVKWAAGAIGSAAPSLAEAAISGVAGAAAGSMLVPGPDPADVATVPIGAIAGMFSKTAFKSAVAKAAEQYVKSGIKREAAEQMATQAVRNTIAKKVGASAAVSQTTAAHEGGGMYMEGREKGYDNPVSALALGQVSGASESLLGIVPSGLRTFIGRSGAIELAKQAGPKVAAGYVWDMAKNSVQEGFQEGLQEFIGTLNENINDPKAKILTKENFMKWAEAGAQGALVGGLFGAVEATQNARQAMAGGQQVPPTEQSRDTVSQTPTPPPLPPTQTSVVADVTPPSLPPTQTAIGDTMSPPPLPTQPPALPTQPPAVPPTQQSPDPIAQRIKSLEKAPSAHKWAEVVLGDRKRFKEAPDEATRIQQWEQARGVDAGQPAQDQSVPTDEATSTWDAKVSTVIKSMNDQADAEQWNDEYRKRRTDYVAGLTERANQGDKDAIDAIEYEFQKANSEKQPPTVPASNSNTATAVDAKSPTGDIVSPTGSAPTEGAVGERVKIMNTPVVRSSIFTDEDNIRHEMFESDDSKSGIVRSIDVDSGNVVSIKKYPSVDAAKNAFSKAAGQSAGDTVSPIVEQPKSQGEKSVESNEQAGWDVIQDTSPAGGGKLYRQDPNPNLKPSQRTATRVAVDPSEGVVLVTKDQFGNAILPETLEARRKFVDGAKEGATFRRPGFNKNALFEVGKGGKIYSIESNSKRESGSVQELANVIQPEDIKELARVADSSADKTPVKRFDNGVTITAQKDKQGNLVPVTSHEGREIVHVVDDKGRGAWFYRSFTGKGGKQQGRWYPVGGVASNKDGKRSWIIKGDPVNDKGFGRPDLAKLEDMVNDVLPSSDEDVDKFLVSIGAEGGFSLENTKAPSQLIESTGSGPYSQEEMGSVLQKWKDDYLTPVWGSRGSSDKPAKRSYRKDNPSEAKAGDIVSPESKRDQEKQDAPQTKEGGDPNEVQTEGRQRSTEGQVSPEDEGQTTGETPSPDSSEVQKAVSGLEKMYGEKVRLVDADKLSEEQQEAIDFIQSKGKTLAFYEVNAPSIGWYQVGTDVILVNNKLEGDALWGAVGHELAHATGLDEAIPFDSAELQADMEAYYEAASPRYKKYLKTNKKTWEREGRARMVQRFFEDSDFRDSLKQSNPTMWENIREAILKFIGQWAPEDAARKKVLEELRAAKKPNAQASPVVTASNEPTADEIDAMMDEIMSKMEESQKAEPKNDPPQQTKASPSAQPDKLKQYGLKVERVGSRWVVSGKTFSNKQILKDVGGQYDVSEKNWWFRSDPTDEIAAQLPDKGDGEQSGDGGDSDADVERKRVRSREAERPDERGTRDSVVESVGDDTKQLIQRGEKFGIPKKVLEGQVEDIGRVTQAFEAGKPMFLVGSAPGMGKSFILGGSIAEIRKRIKANGGTPRFIYVTENQELISQLNRDLSDYGLDDVEFVTYAGIRGVDSKTKKPKRPNASGAVVLIDEAHNAKVLSTQSGESIQEMVKESSFSVYATATPFENVSEAKYLEASGIFDGVEAEVKRTSWNPRTKRNETYSVTITGFDAWAFGYGAELYWQKDAFRPVIYWHKHTTAEEGQIQANEWLASRGIYAQRPMVLPPNMVKSELRAVTVDDKYVQMFDDVLGAYASAEANAENATEAGQVRMHGVNLQKRMLEAAKVQDGIRRANELIKEGKQVIIFVNTKSDRYVGRYANSDKYLDANKNISKQDPPLYQYPEIAEANRDWQNDFNRVKESGANMKDWVKANPRPFAGMIEKIAEATYNADIDFTLPSVIDDLLGALGDNAVDYTGQRKGLSDAQAKVNLTNWKAGKVPVIIATMAKGGTGLSYHDTTGKMPERVQLGINLPWSGTEVEQVSGRLARLGTAKPVGIEWIFADNIPFERELSKTVGSRMRSMQAAVQGSLGDMAQSIKDFEFGDAPAAPVKDRVQQIQDTFPVNREQAIVADILADAVAIPGEIEIAPMGPPPSGRTVIAQQSEIPLTIARNLTPGELDGLRSDVVKDIVKYFESLPPDVEFEEASKAGVAKLGWYKRAAESLSQIFGPDAERFVSLLAATSPRQGVTENLKMTLAIWKAWNEAGRPTTKKQIAKLIQPIPGAMFGSRRPNIIRSLQGQRRLSGYKVSAFAKNLIGNFEEVTNDAWMATFAGIDQKIFGTKSGYLAFTAKIRKVAKKLGLSPAEVQETIWSFTKTLSALRTGGRTSKEALAGMTHEAVASMPEFAELIIGNKDVRKAFKELGLEGVVSRIASEQAAIATEVGGAITSNRPRVLGRVAKRIPAGQGGRGAPEAVARSGVGDTLYQDQRGLKGTVMAWTHFVNASKAIIGATDKADVSSFFHELGHPMRKFLFNRNVSQEERGNITDDDIRKIEDFVGVEYDQDGKPKWDTPAEERFVDALMSYWMEGKAPTKQLETVFEKISKWLSGVLSVIQRKVELTDDVRAIFDKVHQRGGVDPKKMQALREASSESKAVEQEMPKAASGEVRDVLDDLFGDEVPSEVRVEALDKIKAAGIEIKQKKNGWSVTGLPDNLSKEMRDGIKAEGGRKTVSGYFFKNNPASGLVPTAEAIIDANREADEAAAAGLVRTPVGNLSQENAERYSEARQQRLEVAKQMLNASNNSVDELLGNFVAPGKRGLFKISLQRASETGDPDSIPRFDEMIEYSINHPELGLPQDEQGLFERLLKTVIQEEELVQLIDDELANEFASLEEDTSFDFGFNVEPEQLRQTAIEGLEDDVARKESSELFDAKQDKYKQKLKAEIPKMKQQMFLTDIYGNADQGTLFDTDGIAQEDDDLLFQASESPVRQAGRVLKSAIESGVKTFEDFITHAKTQLRDDQILQNASNLETLWSELRSRGGRFAELGPVGSAAELLKPVQKNSESKIGDTMSPVEADKPKSASTGTKYAKTEGQRSSVGDAPREWFGPRNVEERQQEAIAELAANPGRPYEIVADMNARPRPLTDMEDALLNARIRELKNSGDIQGDDREEWLDLNRTVQRGHSEWGYSGHAAQAELAPDFSVEGLTQEHSRYVGADPKPEQLAKYAELAERIEKLENEKLELAEKLAKEAIARKKAEEAAKPKPQPAKDKTETKQEVQQKNVAVAVASFKDKWNSLFSTGETFFQDKGYDPEENRNKIIQAATEVIKAYGADVTSFLELQSQLKGFGIDITDLAAQQTKAFKAAWDAYQKKTKVMSPIGVNPEKAAIGARAKDLMKLALEAGYGATPDTWKEVVDVVHAQLSIEVLGISEYDTMQALSDYGVWRPLNKEEIAVKTRAIRGKARQSLKIEDAIKAIAQSEAWLKSGMSPEEVARRLRDMNWLPKATGSEQATPDSIERELIAEFNKLKKDLPVSAESREGQLKSALTTAKTAGRNRLELLDKDIKALEEAIAAPKELVKPVDERTALKPDEDLLAIRKQLELKRKQRDDLKAKYETIFPSTKPKIGRKPLTDEQRLAMSERMLQSQINAVKEDMKALEAGTWTPAVKSDAPTSIAKEALKAELATLKQAREQARQSSPAYQARKEAKYWEQYRKSQEKRLEFWENRRDDAAAGNTPAPLKKRTITEESILDRNLEIEKVQYEAMYEIEKAKRANWNAGQWINHGLLEATSLIPKTLMLGMEMSYVLRQGFFYARAHPIKAFTALVDSIPAVWSQRLALASMEDIKSRPNAKEYELAKIDFTQKTGPQAKLEEMYQSSVIQWLERTENKFLLPLRTWVKLYGMFESGNRTFANIMKADLYDIQKRDTLAARELFGVSTDWTESDIKETGRIANIFSGRGTGLKGGSPWLDFFFLARRWLWSRLQADFVVPVQLMTPKMIGQWNADRGMRAALAKLYIQTFLGHATKLAMAYFAYSILAGDDEEDKPTMEWDPRASDAWSLKIGETRIKDEGGLMPAIVLAARIATGEMKTSSGEIKSIYGEDVQYGGKAVDDFVIDFARYKLGTGPSAALELMSGRDSVGKVIAKKDDPLAVPKHIVTSRITPLTWREIAAAEKELGVANGTLALLESFFGVSVSTHGDRTEYRQANAAEKEKKFDKDIKKMKFDSPDPAYKEFLSKEQMSQVSERREDRRQGLVYEASSNPVRKSFKNDKTFDQAVRERDAALENMKKSGMSLDDARGLLIKHWESNYGGAKEIRGGVRVYKEALSDRLRQLRKAFPQ